jgi:hypothetical protein
MSLSDEPGEAAESGGQLYRLAWIFYLALAIAGALWIGAREGSLRLELLLDPSSWWRDILAGAAAGGALVVAWALAGRRSHRLRELEHRLREVVGPMSRSDAVGVALLSGFAEELFFRGAVQGSLGWPLATLLFALLHSGREKVFWWWTAFAAVAGLIFAGLTVFTGNLTAAIVAHGLVNGINLPRLAAAETGD